MLEHLALQIGNLGRRHLCELRQQRYAALFNQLGNPVADVRQTGLAIRVGYLAFGGLVKQGLVEQVARELRPTWHARTRCHRGLHQHFHPVHPTLRGVVAPQTGAEASQGGEIEIWHPLQFIGQYTLQYQRRRLTHDDRRRVSAEG